MQFLPIRTIIKRLRNEDGAMAIETAIVLPVFLTFAIGVIMLGHAIMIRHSMYYGMDVASRQAMLAPSTTNSALQTLAKTRMSGMNTNLVTVTVVDSTVGGVASKLFTSSYTYTFPQIIGFPRLLSAPA